VQKNTRIARCKTKHHPVQPLKPCKGKRSPRYTACGRFPAEQATDRQHRESSEKYQGSQETRNPMSITVYSKPACVQCTATYRALERQGIDFNIIDISADTEGFDTVKRLGYMQVPVVVAGDTHWAGFRPDMISALS